MFAHGQTVTRRRAAAVPSVYGSTKRREDWANATDIPIEGAWVASSSSTATADATRQQVITSKSLYCSPGSDVVVGDRIVAGPDTYQVTEKPSADVNPFTGWQPVMECALTLVEG